MIKALLFDFGRVISAQKPKSLFEKYESTLNLPPGTMNTTMFESPFWEQALVGEIDMDEYWQAVGPQLHLYTSSDVTAFKTRYYGDEQINPEVLELLKMLKNHYQLAVVSNHPPGLDLWLKDWDIHWLFEEVICSGEEGVAKPHPEIFYSALYRLDVTASEAVFIDDTMEHVLAAQDLGMLALLFTGAEKLRRDLIERGIIRETS